LYGIGGCAVPYRLLSSSMHSASLPVLSVCGEMSSSSLVFVLMVLLTWIVAFGMLSVVKRVPVDVSLLGVLCCSYTRAIGISNVAVLLVGNRL
jgi:hypothetical protein